MNDPYESYKLYNALKLHFETDSYDALKYNFKTSIKPQSFFNRKDKYFFAKLAKTYGKHLKDFYICLLYTSPSPRDGLLSRMPSSA